MSILAYDLIKSSLRLGTVLASGEDPSPDEANDGLLVLNDMLANWSTEQLSVWGSLNETFPLSAGVAQYTIGPGGTFNTTRPVGIGGGYSSLNGADFPFELINQDQYNAIAVKTISGGPVERVLYVTDFPLGQILVFPVPVAGMSLTLSTRRVLTFPVTLATTLDGPPGYLKALRFCLAVELCPEYGMQAPADVVSIATDAKADFKRSLVTQVVSATDPALLRGGVALWQRGF